MLPELSEIASNKTIPELQFITWVDSQRQLCPRPTNNIITKPPFCQPKGVDLTKKHIAFATWDGQDIRNHEILEIIYV